MIRVSARRMSMPVGRVARRVALALLDEINEASQRLNEVEGNGALHAFRVGVRRLRTCLRSYQRSMGSKRTKKLTKRLGRVTEATNAGRDSQVHIQWLKRQLDQPDLSALERTGARVMLDEYETRMHKEQQRGIAPAVELMRKLDKPLRKQLNRRVSSKNKSSKRPSFARALGRMLDKQFAKLENRFSQCHSVDDREPAHRARLTAKRLRYLIEPVRRQVPDGGEVVQQFKAIQDQIGQLHDLQVLEQAIEQAIEETTSAWARRMLASGEQDDLTSAQPHGALALLALLRRVRGEQRRVFDTVRGRWLDGHDHALAASMRRIVEALTQPAKAAKEESPAAATEGPATDSDAPAATTNAKEP